MTGTDLLALGFQPGPAIGVALRLIEKAGALGEAQIKQRLAAVLADPNAHAGDPQFGELADLLARQSETVVYHERPAPAPYQSWGVDLEPQAVQQMRYAVDLPISVRGALMPDAHLGYGLPVGGVLATDNAVIPYAVGVDIACFTGDTRVPLLDGRTYTLAELADGSRGEFPVFCCAPDGKISVGLATAALTRPDAALVRVTLDSGEQIRCTPDHRFMRRDGSFAAAADLRPGDSLMPYYAKLDEEGYARVQQNYSGRWHRAHWMVARSGLLGPVPKFEGRRTVIHHRNFLECDNRPENLEFMGDANHGSFHRSLVVRNEYWHSEDFEDRRKAALAAKAATPEGHEYFAARGAANLKRYWAERYDVAKANCAGNGKRGKAFLVAKNASDAGRARSREVAARLHRCELCGEEVRSYIGLYNHQRSRHGLHPEHTTRRRNHTVVSVETLAEREAVYCLSVPGHENFAVAAGVFVHNCRMKLSIFDVSPDDLKKRGDHLTNALERETKFGIGQEWKKPLDHPVVDADWTVSPVTRRFRQKAHNQLGTSGSGNHFVEWGTLTFAKPDLGMEAGTYLALLSHSGSRGTGASVADYYSRLAMEKHPELSKELRHLAWLDMASDAGQEYWAAMELMGEYASANHDLIHKRVAKAAGFKPSVQVENHHNFCIPSDELVGTTEGPKPMEEVRIGDLVYAFDEAKGVVPTRVTAAGRTGIKPLCEIETDGRRLRCTAEHPVLTVRLTRGPHPLRPWHDHTTAAYEWRKADQVNVGDLLVCAAGYGPRHLDPPVGEAQADCYLRLCQTVLPRAAWKQNTPGQFGLTCSSRDVYGRVVQLGLADRSTDRRVPRRAFGMTRAAKLELIAGYLDADGSVSGNAKNRGRGTVATVSRGLADDVREMAVSCGLRITPVRESRIRTNFGPTTVYRCTLAASAVAELDLWHPAKSANARRSASGALGGLSPRKLGGLEPPLGAFVQRVRRTSRSDLAVPVYDLTVDHPSHSFICSGVVVHNCWREQHDGREVYVHRKGATPAGEGVLGVIPGSMATPGYVVRGRGNAESLRSASHGAGRVMSRTAAKHTFRWNAVKPELEAAGVTLLSAGIDEAPGVYKDIHAVMAAQRDLVEVVAEFNPKIVKMAPPGDRAED